MTRRHIAWPEMVQGGDDECGNQSGVLEESVQEHLEVLAALELVVEGGCEDEWNLGKDGSVVQYDIFAT